MTVDSRSSHNYNAPRSLIEGMVAFTIVLAIWLFFLWNAWSGIDFGYHWDEAYTQVSVQETVESGVLVPTFYFYPGMCYDLGLLALIPQVRTEFQTNEAPWMKPDSEQPPHNRFDVIQDRLQKHVSSTEYLVRYRTLCALIASLLVFWAFAIGFVASNSIWIGVFISSIVGFSWEFLYHSRWGVPDAMTASFAGLTIFLALLLLKAPYKKWLLAASAVAAGLTAATKYPGSVVLAVVWIAALVSTWGRWSEAVRQFARATGIFFVTFLILSPGTLLNPLRLYDSLQYIKHDYATGHPGHTITAGLTHIGAIFGYLATSLPSHILSFSLTIGIIAVAGAILLIRHDRKIAYAVIVPFLFYILYMGSQHVFFVRNSLLLLPFGLVLLAYALGKLWISCRYRYLIRTLVVSVFLLNIFLCLPWILSATASIVNRVAERPNRALELQEFLASNTMPTYLSPRLQSEFAVRNLRTPECVISDQNGASRVAFYSSEAATYDLNWHGDERTLTVATFGPREVNFNYYPLWAGEDRIVLMTGMQARSCGINFTTETCGPWPLYEL